MMSRALKILARESIKYWVRKFPEQEIERKPLKDPEDTSRAVLTVKHLAQMNQ